MNLLAHQGHFFRIVLDHSGSEKLKKVAKEISAEMMMNKGRREERKQSNLLHLILDNGQFLAFRVKKIFDQLSQTQFSYGI